MVADVLSRSILRACEDGSIVGIKTTREGPMVSHILFTDDFLLFLHANESVARNIFILLEEYCLTSSKQINYHKSSVIFTPNTPPELKA